MADGKTVLRCTEQGPALIVHFNRDELFEGETVASLEQELPPLWTSDDHTLWIFDFTGVRMIVSQVLSLVLRSHKRLRERNGEARLSGLNPDVQRVFELAGLHQLFTIYDTPESALQADGPA